MAPFALLARVTPLKLALRCHTGADAGVVTTTQPKYRFKPTNNQWQFYSQVLDLACFSVQAQAVADGSLQCGCGFCFTQ